jgi:hypothetical protein
MWGYIPVNSSSIFNVYKHFFGICMLIAYSTLVYESTTVRKAFFKFVLAYYDIIVMRLCLLAVITLLLLRILRVLHPFFFT